MKDHFKYQSIETKGQGIDPQSAYLAASYAQPPERDRSATDQAMERLRNNIQEMAACVQMMEQSLRIVMTPEDAGKEACYGQTPQALSCELVHNINDASAQVAYQVKALRRQIERLEV